MAGFVLSLRLRELPLRTTLDAVPPATDESFDTTTAAAAAASSSA